MSTDVSKLLNILGRGGKYQYISSAFSKDSRISHWFEVGSELPVASSKADVFFGVHPTNEIPKTNAEGKIVSPEYVRSRIEYISAINCLFAEFDMKDGAGLETIHALKPKPSIVIASGGGWHCYWLLSEPVSVTHENRQQIKAIQYQWVDYVKSDEAAKDLARTLRVPGYRNHKYEGIRIVEFVTEDCDFDLLYNIETLKSYLTDFLINQPTKTNNAPKTEFKETIIPEHTRNATLFRIACSLVAKGFEQETILLEISKKNEKLCVPPLDDSEVDKLVKSALRYPQGDLVSEKYNLTDLGNAKRFIELHKDKAVYCSNQKEWFIWNGRYWEIDYKLKVKTLAEDVIKRLYTEAAQAVDSEERKQLAQHATRSESNYSINQMVDIAKSYLAVTLDEFDTDKELLNVKNGTINLRTGELLSHNPDNKITKMVNYEYHPEAKCPKWLEFLNFIQNNDQETIRWIQKALGYSVSGRSDAKVLPFLYGKDGFNGKSTFVETLMRIFRDYSQKTDIEALSDFGNQYKDGERPKAYLARLKGARLVITNEVQQRVKLNVAMVKDLTGNDTLTARGVHATNPISFTPTHTIWIYGNHKPVIADDGNPIWERVCLIPFEKVIPVEMRKPMDDVIDEFLSEAEGILAWIVEGYQLYLKEGLKKTNSIVKATEEFRTEEDIVLEFIEEKCRKGDNFRTTKDDLYNAFCTHVKSSGEKIEYSKKMFTQAIQEKGIKVGGHGNGFYMGVMLLPANINSFEESVDTIFNN